MYAVSNAYKAASAAADIINDIVCEIDGTEYGSEYIFAGSFTITNQCTGTDDISLGSVYVGQLTATFQIPETSIARASWQGRTITATYKLWTGSEYEELPLGIFRVSEVTYTTQGTKVVAYDDMTKFDRSCAYASTGGKAFDLLSIACSACGMTMATTRAQIEAMPNGQRVFGYYKDGDVKTWRDFLHYITAVLCAFATINRAGQLEIRQFGATAVDSIGTGRREYSASFSDYATHYTGIAYTIIDTSEYVRVAATTDDGTTIDLGSNPFLQTSAAITEAAVADLLTAVGTLEYTPFTAAVAGNPAYDLGDCLTFAGGRAGTASTACIMKYTYASHRRFTMNGYGANPAIAEDAQERKKRESSTRAAVNSMSKKIIEANRYGVVFLLPTEQYPLPTDTPPGLPIGDGDSAEVLRWEFEVTQEKAPAAVHAIIETHVETLDENDTYTDCSVNIEVRGDGALIATWDEVYGDGEHLIETDVIKKYFETGDHVITVKITPNGGNLNPALKVKSAYLETRARVHVAKSWSKSYFWRDTALSNCEVSNINTYVNGSTQAGINALSEHFLTGEVLWLNSGVDNGGRLWRINKNTKALWTGASFTYTHDGHQYQLRQDSGQTVFMTKIHLGDGTSNRFVSAGGAGAVKLYIWSESAHDWQYISNSTATTYREVESINGGGEWRSGFDGTGATCEIVTNAYLEDHECVYKLDDLADDGIAVESKFALGEFALREFFGTDENDPGTAINPYPNRYLLSYNGSGVTKTYIPVSRDTFGWQTISAAGKLFQSGTSDPLVGIGAGAVVDGQMVEVVATSTSTSWADITADISELPYIDYIILYGKDGAQGLREIHVSKTEIPEDEEEW